MDEFPIVERVSYNSGQRGRDFLYFILCLIAPVFVFWLFPDHVAYLRGHGSAGLLPYQNIWNFDHPPGTYSPSQPRFVLLLLMLPVGCVYFLWAVLFKADQLYTITTDEITYERRSLMKQTKQTWSVKNITEVKIRTRSGAFVGDNYGVKPSEDGFQIQINFKSGDSLNLPVRRHYAHALRIKQAIDSLLT